MRAQSVVPGFEAIQAALDAGGCQRQQRAALPESKGLEEPLDLAVEGGRPVIQLTIQIIFIFSRQHTALTRMLYSRT